MDRDELLQIYTYHANSSLWSYLFHLICVKREEDMIRLLALVVIAMLALTACESD